MFSCQLHLHVMSRSRKSLVSIGSQTLAVSFCYRSSFLCCNILSAVHVSCLPLLIGQMTGRILTHHHVHDVEGEDVDGEQGEGHGEQVEVSVVPLAHAVSDPRTVVIETVCEKEKKVGV